MLIYTVNTVIIYDFPLDSKQYIHRIGRTGRADRIGIAQTFWTDVDTDVLSVVVNVMKQSGQTKNVPDWMLEIDSINKPLTEEQRKAAKLGKTVRGPIRKGGDYVHGTSVLKRAEQNTKKKRSRKRHRKESKKKTEYEERKAFFDRKYNRTGEAGRGRRRIGRKMGMGRKKKR